MYIGPILWRQIVAGDRNLEFIICSWFRGEDESAQVGYIIGQGGQR